MVAGQIPIKTHAPTHELSKSISKSYPSLSTEVADFVGFPRIYNMLTLLSALKVADFMGFPKTYKIHLSGLAAGYGMMHGTS